MQDDFPESSPPFPVSCSRGFIGEEGEVGEVGSCATADGDDGPLYWYSPGDPTKVHKGARPAPGSRTKSSLAGHLPGFLELHSRGHLTKRKLFLLDSLRQGTAWISQRFGGGTAISRWLGAKGRFIKTEFKI